MNKQRLAEIQAELVNSLRNEFQDIEVSVVGERVHVTLAPVWTEWNWQRVEADIREMGLEIESCHRLPGPLPLCASCYVCKPVAPLGERVSDASDFLTSIPAIAKKIFAEGTGGAEPYSAANDYGLPPYTEPTGEPKADAGDEK